MKRLILFFFIIFVFWGCSTTKYKPLTVEDVIWTPKTLKGKTLKEKYFSDLLNIFDVLKANRINLVKNGIYIAKSPECVGKVICDIENKFYLGIAMMGTMYNNIQVKTFNSRAASAILKYLPIILNSINFDQLTLARDKNYQGILVSINWGEKNFVTERYVSPRIESVLIYINSFCIKEYRSNKLTLNELLNKSKIFGYKGRIKLGLIKIDLKSAI